MPKPIAFPQFIHYTDPLLEAVHELYDHYQISSTYLAVDAIYTPLFDIASRLERGDITKHRAREMYRARRRYLQSIVTIDLPSLEEIINGSWEYPEMWVDDSWEIYCDNDDVHDLIIKAPQTLFPGDVEDQIDICATDVLKMLYESQAHPVGSYFGILHVWSEGYCLVFSSPSTGRGELLTYGLGVPIGKPKKKGKDRVFELPREVTTRALEIESEILQARSA